MKKKICLLLGLILVGTIFFLSGCQGNKLSKEELIEQIIEKNNKVQYVEIKNDLETDIHSGFTSQMTKQELEGNAEYDLKTKQIKEGKVRIKSNGSVKSDVTVEFSNGVYKETNNIINNQVTRYGAKYTMNPDFHQLIEFLSTIEKDLTLEETDSAYLLKLKGESKGLELLLENQYRLKLSNINFGELDKELSLEFEKDTFYLKSLKFNLLYDGSKGKIKMDNITVFSKHNGK